MANQTKNLSLPGLLNWLETGIVGFHSQWRLFCS